MKNEKSKNIIIALLVLIIIVLVVLVVLFANDTISFNSNKIDTNSTQKNEDNAGANNIDSNNLEYNGEDVSDGEVEQIYISRTDSIELDYDFYIIMTLSGKVKVTATDENGNSSTDYLTNISNVIDIIHFPVQDFPEDQLVYILLANGDVYYYKVGDSIDKNYTAVKVENVSNVKKLFIYSKGKANAGGSLELIAVTEENKFVSLNQQAF